MTAVPSTRVWVAGEVVTDAFMNNNLSAPLNYLLAPPIFKGLQTSAQTITTATFTAVTYDSEVVDSAGGHSTVTNTSRYTAVYGGWYRKGGGGAFASNATGRRLHRINVNSSTLAGTASGVPANAAVIPWAFRNDRIFLNVGDFAEDMILQDSGGNLATFVTNSEYQCTMTLDWASN